MKVNNDLEELYSGYYNDDAVQKKRVISARDSVREINIITKRKSFKHLLDVGVGEGAVLQELENARLAEKISAVEISESGIAAVKERNLKTLQEIKKFDGYTLPYPDNCFDLAISTYVLEHVEHERLFLQEISRVANKVIISVPLEHTINLDKAIVAGKNIGHINFYTLDTFRSILETSGLIIEDSYAYTTSKEYETFVSPRFGLYKYFIRNTTLSISPKIACGLFTYYAIAMCKTQSNN